MNQRTSMLCRSNLRAYTAAFISYVMLAGQFAPLALAAAPKRTAPPAIKSSAPIATEPLHAAPMPAPMPYFAPSITATKVDSFPDPNGNGKAEPGDTITYTVTITNSGPDPATGVTFTDSVDTNTSLVANSVQTQPIAQGETISVLGNVRVSTANGAPNLLANDCDPDDATPPCNSDLTASGPTTSTHNGNVTVNADGTFSYNPAPGYTGPDDFTYTVRDRGPDGIPGNADDKSDTASVTITVGPTLVWFIDNTAAAGGDGRITTPFNSITAFNATAADDPGDIIFIYNGSGTYTGGITLLNTQKLIGQGFSLATQVGTVPTGSDPLPAAGAAPTINNAGANIITLGQDNVLRGFNTGNSGAAGTDITGSGFNTLTVSNLSINGDGRALNLTNGTLAATVAGISASNTGTNTGITFNNVGGSLVVSGTTTITNPGGTGIDLTNLPNGASLNFGATTVDKSSTSGVGVNLATNNAGATTTFTSLTITAGASFALQTNAGGTVNASSGSLTQSGAGGGAASLTNTALGLTFTTVSSNGGANGIIFSGGTGTFTSGTTNLQNNAGIGISMSSSGVAANFGNTTVNSSAGNAISLSSNTGNITFADCDLTPDAGLRAFDAQNNTGTLTVSSGDITNSGGTTAAPIFIDGPAGRTPINITFTSVTTSGVGVGTTTPTVASIHLVDVSGTKFQITGTTQINSRFGTGIYVNNATTTNIQFGTTNIPNASNQGGYGIRIDNSSSAVTISSAAISGANQTTAQTDSNNDGVADTDGDGDAIFLKNNTGSFTLNGGSLTNSGGDGIDIRGATNISISNVTIDGVGQDVSGASVGGVGGHGIYALNMTGTNSLTGVTITNWETAATNGLRWWNNAAGTGTLTLHGTSFTNSETGSAAIIYRADSTAVMTLNVGGTNAGDPCNFTNITGEAINHSAGNSAGSTGTANLTVQNSNFTNNAATKGQNSISARNVEGGIAAVSITGNTFDGVGRTAADTSGVLDLGSDGLLAGNSISFNITGNTIRNVGDNITNSCGALPCTGKRAIDVFIDDNGNVNGTIVIDNNVITNVQRNGIIFDTGSAFNGTNFSAKITNNRVGIRADNTIDRVGIGTALSAGGESGIRIENRNSNAKSLNILVSNNQVYNGNGAAGSSLNGSGIFIRAQNSATLAATVTNNTVNTNNTSTANALRADTNFSAGGNATVCLDASGNTLNAVGAHEISLNEIQGILNVEQGSLAALSAANGGAVTQSDNGTPQFGVTCATPPAATIGSDTELVQVPGGGSKETPAADATEVTPVLTPRTTNTTIAPKPAVAPKATVPAAKREGGTTFRYAAEATSAPLNPASAPEPVAAQKKPGITTPVLVAKPHPNGAGGTVSVNIGTLPANDSVTITFQVVVDNPYSGGPNVSNRGQVSGTNFTTVNGLPTNQPNTDDPDTPVGPPDATLTPINSTDIRINDATVAEPSSNTAQMLFTLTLSQPAPAGGISVNYATANGGATPATGGASCGGTVDYVTTSGTATVPAGSQVATIPVTVCADTDSPESNETFLLNISGASAGTIQDAQATGTITQGTTAGTFLISELRTSGPGGSSDEFVEFYNNTNSPLTVTASDASAGYGLFKMGATCADTPVLLATIPNGTVIPARGHYLAVGSAYTLANYGGTGAAAGNVTMASDIENDRNIAVFTTANVANLSSASRLDAVGGDSNTGAICDLLREGNNLPAVAGSTLQYTFFRSMGLSSSGNPKDTNDNAADFTFADTQGTFIAGITQKLGAPGPENLASPIRRDTTGVGLPLISGGVAAQAHPNRSRAFTSDPANNSTFGTLTIRRRVVNNTGGNVTRLRFRIVDMTTFPSPPGVADLRPRTGVVEASIGPINDAATCTASGAGAPPCNVSVQPTTLETPPAQPNGGGINSTLSAGSITLGTPLANGASLNVNFLLGIQQTGSFRFLIIIEALP